MNQSLVGNFQLSAAMVVGGQLSAGSPGTLLTVVADSTLDGVRLDANAVIADTTELNVRNGLTLNRTLTLNGTYNTNFAPSLWTALNKLP